MFLLLKRSKLFGVRGWYIVKQVVLFALCTKVRFATFSTNFNIIFFVVSICLHSFLAYSSTIIC